MSRRLPQTPADFLVIGLSPALIMLLVGSLVFFLVEVFYQGEYRLRLSFILAMFVMATVCIARISMVEGAGYAFLFAVPLALVTFIAMVSFVQVSGVWVVLSWPVNMFLIALVWWCTHKLTWDCTLIDEKQDASGQGLLQTMGLDGDESAETKPKVKLPLWERWFGEKKKQPHAPGVWVVYFSIAALPLFGLGQLFIASSNISSRRYAFWLLLVYVASALALLLATSFLGLRRYLRQRQIEMPDDVAGVWVSVGSIMIVVLLAFCFLLPRPRAEYAISQLPFELSSPLKLPSRWGFGNDGPQDNKLGTRTGPQSQSGGEGQGKGSEAKSQGSDSGKQGSGESGRGSEKGPGSKEGQGSGTDRQGEEKGAEEQGSGASSGSQQGQSGSTSSGPQNSGANQSSGSGSSPGSQTQQNSQSQSQQQASQSQQAQSNPSPPAAQPSSLSLSSIFSWIGWFLGSVLKLAFYTVLAVSAAYFAWRYRKELAAAFKKFVDELKALWARFFGARTKATKALGDTGPAQPVYKRFADFADPFTSGLVSRLTPAELVRYTFEAVEAWGREHNCPREPHQTPHEFAEQLGRGQAALARDAGILAELYCRVAYAAGTLPDAAVQHVRQVWNVLRPAVG